mgnify:CR=1 FL=1
MHWFLMLSIARAEDLGKYIQLFQAIYRYIYIINKSNRSQETQIKQQQDKL